VAGRRARLDHCAERAGIARGLAERILDVASERIREQGLDEPGVAEIMQAAGLTHGGFYKHFESRDDLIAQATETALAASDRHVHELTDQAQDTLAAFVDWYLSAEHRDDPGAGCAVPRSATTSAAPTSACALPIAGKSSATSRTSSASSEAGRTRAGAPSSR
jgi:AcrR family transcriptional regulator